MKYLYLQSILQQDESLVKKANDLFDYIEEETGIPFISAPLEEVSKEDISVVYISSGGTAGMFKKALPSLKAPIILLTSGSDNSLSASMEIMTYLANEGIKGRMIHGDKNQVANKLEILLSGIGTINALKGLRLGLFGEPSDWLISASVNYDFLKEKFGIEIVQVEMSELLDEISKKSYVENASTQALMAKDFDKDQINSALEIYGAFSRLVEKYNLDGFSVRCFDLLTHVKNSGCLGLALLNQEGIYAGCEGDLPSLISMVILGKISKNPVFQSNPSRVDSNKNDIIFAHCTLPLNMPTKYKLDTHFESGIGVAVSGDIPTGSATIFKATGMLDRYFISSATIDKSLHENDLCRSQILVHCEEGVDEFFNTPVGNHYLVCLGDYSEHLREMFSLLEVN